MHCKHNCVFATSFHRGVSERERCIHFIFVASPLREPVRHRTLSTLRSSFHVKSCIIAAIYLMRWPMTRTDTPIVNTLYCCLQLITSKTRRNKKKKATITRISAPASYTLYIAHYSESRRPGQCNAMCPNRSTANVFFWIELMWCCSWCVARTKYKNVHRCVIKIVCSISEKWWYIDSNL